MTHTRILIADDHEIVRSGLRRILQAQPQWEVVAEAGDGREAVVKSLATKPNVVVIDYSMPLLNGVEATRQICEQLPRTQVLMFTMHDQEAVVREVLKAGARGYLLKSNGQEHLIEAVEALAQFKPYFPPQVSELLVKDYAKKPDLMRDAITPRERTIVQLIAEGHSSKVIANMLDISVKTVETHRNKILYKLNLENAAALVRYAVRNGLVEA
jgi:DNA-binding NarL/FixJ family response regulator